jgi:hypothetical protein
MSTPSPVPLDNFDPVSPYAPKRAHQQSIDAETADEPLADLRHPPGIETDHDARILDEIEVSLRAMISANLGDDEPERLSDVSRLAAEEIAQQQYLQQLCARQQQLNERAEEEPSVGAADVAEARHELHAPDRLAADVATVREALHDPRTPPWLLARSLDPEPIPEPVGEHWPQPRKRGRANRIFLRFGLAATGAAIVAAIAIKDIPSLVLDKVRGPIMDLSSNAAAVFNEGKASGLQARIDAAQKEQDRARAQTPAQAPVMSYAVASADPKAGAIPVKTETVARAPERRETVMTPWPSPDIAKRNEPAGWQEAPARMPAQTQPPSQSDPATVKAAPSRALSEEEIAMLRKMGDDYISNGDFVGARGVLERAAQAGDASAAFAIASTYDPVVLTRFKVRGLEPDIVKASFWYERARELGSSEAPHRLQAMLASRGN